MREDPTDGILDLGPTGDNIVELPNLATGRLADLLAAASGPAQDHELRGELAARTAFLAASDAWPTTRRRFRRTPAVLAVTTVATMMVATTGLAAASELPGPAGRAVQGILGTVGVTIQAPAPAAPVDPAPTAAVTPPPTSHGLAGSHHVGPVRKGCGANAAATGSIETASCTITVPRHAVAAAPATPAPAAAAPAKAAAPKGGRGGNAPSGPGGAGQHHGGSSGTGSGSTGGSGVPPGGGTSRGGNQGTGGGTCGSSGGGTTTTTDPGSSTTTGDTTTTDPTSTDPTSTDPSGTGTGCGGHRGHHHGGAGGTTGTTSP